jgi:ATP-dependent HslUV protease ATP-binding subunit HslU
VNTKKGNVNTEYILFIAAGSFHSVKPSDLLPELQGRLPIRVNLDGLTEQDMFRILTEPVNNLLKQQVALFPSSSFSMLLLMKRDDSYRRWN